MHFALNETQNMLIETAQRVGERFGLDYWRGIDARKEYPVEYWQAICDAGLAGIVVPEAYGGSGLGMLDLALAVEALAQAGGGSTVGQLFMNNPIFCGISVSLYGSEQQKRDHLPKMVSGEKRYAMALTEPDAGTNTLAMKSFARADGEGWRLSGQKIWITGVPESDGIIVVARTQAADQGKKRSEGLSMFLIDTEREGLTYTPIEKLGTHTQSASIVFFDDVRIEPQELLGTLNKGWHELLDVLNTERIVTTSSLVGTASLCLKLAVEYASNRKVFNGTPIGAYQGLQFPLAHSFALNEAARILNFKAAVLFDEHKPYGSEANAAKLLAGEAAGAAADRAMQTMGGMGYAKESHVERLWRDARLFRIAPISEEMVLNFIARENLGMQRSY
ncbi:acyl-CoA dehydrogenase family protein [Paraburkholderia xenovorans]|uniref:acyl-CoA dehydrogenase family protein n=1 Tax=Paraburkholderia xenovorans TaxID=36873 RepID=UPI001559A07C|nr:acyl-CoA dehydrogenase family protein [Paraburkholderia xenovorans]NPT38507.1 acyl-CoA dehydrogenase [Paraburkholderia xenovorans]